jgi:hypothetical protein
MSFAFIQDIVASRKENQRVTASTVEPAARAASKGGVLLHTISFMLRCRPLRRSLFTLAAIAALAALLFVPSAIAGSSGVTVASGSFTLLGSNGEHRTFAFTVTELSDGTVKGEAQLITFSGFAIHIAINCFTQVGNQAIIGGTVTESPQAPDRVGFSTAFAIQDNPDIATLVLTQPPGVLTCANYVDLMGAFFGEPDLTAILSGEFAVPISTGNIMIHQAN